MESPEIIAAAVGGLAAIVVSFITSLLTGFWQVRQLREELRTEYMAEEVVRKLLNRPDWRRRSFEVIKSRLKGFDDDELRKILVRAGAVSFKGNEDETREFWGLRERNEDSI